MNKKGGIHLSLHNRKTIEKALNVGMNCKSIARQVNKDERTVSKEIKKRRDRKENGKFGLYSKRDLSTCKTLSKFPFVCNNCKCKASCFKQYKYYYDANIAQENYEIILNDSRVGLDTTLENKAKFDAILKSGIEKGQSIHHIIEMNKDKICYSERTAYRLVNTNKTLVQSIDLVRKVKLKPRKHYKYKEDNKIVRVGRKYEDFVNFISKQAVPFIVEIDTVESVKSGSHKCLLTIHFTNLHFMLIYVLDQKTKENVNNVFKNLQKLLGDELYKKVFPLILTDRGTEFCDPIPIECNIETGEILSHLYYCNSYSSYQKGAIEENHELIRRIIPKSTVFDDLTQEKAELIASHINSYERKTIETTPYKLAEIYFGKSFLEKTKIREINPDLITLKAILLK